MSIVKITAVAALILTGAASVSGAPPRLMNPGIWLQKREAPASSLKQGERALTMLDLTIAQDGSVATCETVLPSKSPTLDQYACTLFRQNARYEPLRGETQTRPSFAGGEISGFGMRLKVPATVPVKHRPPFLDRRPIVG